MKLLTFMILSRKRFIVVVKVLNMPEIAKVLVREIAKIK